MTTLNFKNLVSGLGLGLGLNLVAATSLMTTGCGADSELDLSQLPIVSEDGLEPGELTWTRPSSTQINCVRAPCPTYMVYNVNTSESELVYAFDWRALQVSSDEATKLTSSVSQMLLYGRYAQSQAFGESVQVFQVTRADVRVSQKSVDSPLSDRYYEVRSADICTQQSCPQLLAVPLNQIPSQSELWSGMDLSRLGLDQEAQAVLLDEIKSGRAPVSTADPKAMPVALTEAFRPYKSIPLP